MNQDASTQRSVVIEREMPHAPEKIWRALTQSSLIEEWLMQNDFQPMVGPKFTFRATPMPHWNGVTDCEVLELEANARLSYSWNASGSEAPNGLKTIVTWTLTPTKAAPSCGWSSQASVPKTTGTIRARITAGSDTAPSWKASLQS